MQAIRWWELRKNLGNWSIYQEGTHAPADGLRRWMGSIAMDANGIIALGYSTSSSTTYPDIRYTARIPADPLGVMTFAETVIQAGGGSQTSTSSRWGDYTQMTVDPSVSNTFWYTNEYYSTTSDRNWKTRIAAFSFDPVQSINYMSSLVTGGNDNGAIDFNECNNLFITLTNIGSLNATGISAILSSTTPGVTITQSSSTFPDINIGLSGSNTTAYKISTSPSFACGANISFSLNVTYTGGSKVINFSLPSGTLGGANVFENNTSTPIVDNSITDIPIPAWTFGSIGKVTLSLHVTHTNDQDLDFYLIAPDGTSVELSTDNGSTDDNYGTSCADQTIFDDDASNPIVFGTAPFVGTFSPEGSLAVFKGKEGTAVNGIWTLRIIDDQIGNAGTFHCALLSLSLSGCLDGGGDCLATNLGIKVIPEGFYNISPSRLNMKDTVLAYLRNVTSPYDKVDSAKAVIDSTTFTGDFTFWDITNGTYYIALNHRNSIETWSKIGGEAITKGAAISYDFTDAQNKAYGNNMVQKGTKWCIYSGDVNQDGLVDGTDLAGVDNDNTNFASGYVTTDLTGDNSVDGSDLALVDNNSTAFVTKIVPPGAIAVKREQPFPRLTKEEIK